MTKEIDLKIQSGPCVVCGETNYPLSMGGPDICPACDCGCDLKTRLAPLKELIKQLQAENKQQADLLVLAKEQMDAQAEENKRLREMLLSIKIALDSLANGEIGRWDTWAKLRIKLIDQILKETQ